MPRNRLWIAAAMALALGACSTVPYARRLADRQAAYAAAAGEPVRSFRFFNLYSWEPLGDRQLAVYTRPGQAWLLDVSPCLNLPYANAIGLTSAVNEVSVNFDRVLTGRDYAPCVISRIRPLDVARLKLAQQAQRRIEAAARPSSAKQ